MVSGREAAVAATLALLLEVSGNPKAGNVDREHDFEDLRYEHFLASAAGAFPVFLEVSVSRKVGEGIYNAVVESRKWHTATNVHFGAFLLLVPLIAAWDKGGKKEMAAGAVDVLKKTSYGDSLLVLKAFRMSEARVVEAAKMDLSDNETERRIVEERINLYEWMKMAPEENLIAKELIGGYRISLEGAELLMSLEGDVNERIVLLYHTLLSRYPDPLIMAKKGRDYAVGVMEMARKVLEGDMSIEELDRKLIEDGANPGTIADLTASSIYFALIEGWKV